MTESTPYNPLDTDNIGESLLNALLACEPIRMDNITEFPGAGVYAIYYRGDFPAYAQISAANQDEFTQAIYVGKAIPSGGRKGAVAFGQVTGKYVYRRLKEHGESIEAANNLAIEDFFVRYLIIEPIWIPLAETLMINRNLCVWNILIEGFGNHDPGANRHGGKRTVWDTLHPGRWWADKASDNPKWTAASAAQEAKTWIKQRS